MAHDNIKTRLDANQVIKRVYDDDTESLRTLATVAISDITFDVNIDSETDSITIGNPNNGNTLDVKADGSINVLQIGQLVPTKFDKIEILTKNLAGDPLSVRYSQLGSTVATLTIVYDIDGDISSVTRS